MKYRLELWPPDVSLVRLNIRIQTIEQHAVTIVGKQLSYAPTDVYLTLVLNEMNNDEI